MFQINTLCRCSGVFVHLCKDNSLHRSPHAAACTCCLAKTASPSARRLPVALRKLALKWQHAAVVARFFSTQDWKYCKQSNTLIWSRSGDPSRNLVLHTTLVVRGKACSLKPVLNWQALPSSAITLWQQLFCTSWLWATALQPLPTGVQGRQQLPYSPLLTQPSSTLGLCAKLPCSHSSLPKKKKIQNKKL